MMLHDLKSRLQQHLSDGLVVVIGSGLSCAEGLPGMGELANHLCDALPLVLDPPFAKEWDDIASLITTKGLEAALLELAPSQELEASIVVATSSLFADLERNVITEVFARGRLLRLTRLIKYLMKPSAGLPIITTNYDRLIEIAVEEAGLGVDNMFVGSFAGSLNERESRLSFCREVTLKKNRAAFTYRPRIMIYKPHGSLDWYLRDGKPVHYAGDLPDASRLIITPGRNKFRTGYDSPFDTHRDRANHAIEAADRFLIIGYGFNDDHLETHLSPAIRGGKPTLMLTKTLSPAAKTLAENHANVIALEFSHKKGMDGTSAIVDNAAHFYPDQKMWDIGAFVEEVLEP